jgi:hypothetical protein
MMIATSMLVALSFVPSVAFAEGTRLFMHYIPHSADLEGDQPDSWKTVISSPTACGVQIMVPWSFIDKGGGKYDWSALDQFIALWASQGKLTALHFSAAASNVAQQMGPTLYNTPLYVLESGAPIIQCHQELGGGKPSPPTPDFLDPRVLSPWRAFIRAGLAHYEDDLKIAYLRWAIGGDESYPETDFQLDPQCLPKMEAVGINADSWLTHGLNSVDFVASLAPHVQITWDLNALATLDLSQYNFANKVSAKAKSLHELSGNDGFPNSLTADFYSSAAAPYIYAQSSGLSYTGGYAGFPSNMAEAEKLGIHTLEINSDYWSAAFDPSYSAYPKWHTTYQATFKSLNPITGSLCRLRPGQY